MKTGATDISIIIAFLRLQDIFKINRNNLEKIFSKYRCIPKFKELLEQVPENLDEAFEILIGWQYLAPKINELNTYRIIMKEKDAIKSIETIKKNPRKYELLISLTKLYVDEKANFLELFDSRKELEEKPKRKISSGSEFLYLFFSLLQLDCQYIFDEKAFINAFGFSFLDSNSFFDMLDFSFQRPFLREDVMGICQKFLFTDPLFPEENSQIKINDYVLKRRALVEGFSCFTRTKLQKSLEILRQLDPQDYAVLENLKNQYLGRKENKVNCR